MESRVMARRTRECANGAPQSARWAREASERASKVRGRGGRGPRERGAGAGKRGANESVAAAAKGLTIDAGVELPRAAAVLLRKRVHRAAGDAVLFEHEHAPADAREQGRDGQAADARADHDGIERPKRVHPLRGEALAVGCGFRFRHFPR